MAWATGEPMDLRERVFNWSPVEAGSGGTVWCVEQELCPTFMPGDLVVPDKLSGHKKPAIGTAIRAKGARLLVLPPYSPDLNPIEQVFTKLKHLLRKPQSAPRRQPGSASGRSWTRLRRKSAKITWPKPGMCRPNVTRFEDSALSVG
ncbi:DDE superfamily endonuclease [Acidiphilium rubrum]|uniref:DDE superfamily endonuclease n=1 Tax=Acidiphilium rubrum TaxID=526 RepID=A0A8G2FEC0_ACIRU|nr:DDE superfamily endonuclease [Acidiphilium rubrum]